MKKSISICGLLILSLLFILNWTSRTIGQPSSESDSQIIGLPKPETKGTIPIERTLVQRRSIRNFSGKPITVSQLSQLLWAAQGVTDECGFRTTPSAGALYPLEIYAVVSNVENLAPGAYKYLPIEHQLMLHSEGNIISELTKAALSQAWMNDAAAVIIIAGVYERTINKYYERGVRYVHIEAGCAAENIYLQAEALNLGTTLIGAFDDKEVAKIAGMERNEKPLAIMPIGNKK